MIAELTPFILDSGAHDGSTSMSHRTTIDRRACVLIIDRSKAAQGK
jgi:hypothetical protein